VNSRDVSGLRAIARGCVPRPVRVLRWRWKESRIARRLAKRQYREIWIDVGAHEGETTIRSALARPEILVYAFEPDLRVASRSMGILSNFVPLPMAVASHDGTADLHINAYEGASSLLKLDPAVAERWIGGGELSEIRTVQVPTIRLDTFMDAASIAHVDYLKVDTQGADLDVLMSAGERLSDISRLTIEVTVGDYKPYLGAPDRKAVMSFLEERGFRLVATQSQTHWQEENLTFVSLGANQLHGIS